MPTPSASPSKPSSSSPCATQSATPWPPSNGPPPTSPTYQAQRLFGDPDYLLRILTRDLAAFQQLYDDRLAALPGVQRLSSTLVMKSIVENRPLPL